MRQRDKPTLPCADAGPVSAAFSESLTLHRAYHRVKRCQLDRSSQENRHTCAGYRHSIARSARRLL